MLDGVRRWFDAVALPGVRACIRVGVIEKELYHHRIAITQLRSMPVINSAYRVRPRIHQLMTSKSGLHLSVIKRTLSLSY